METSGAAAAQSGMRAGREISLGGYPVTRWIDDADDMATEIANGALVAHAFANFYATTTLADPGMVTGQRDEGRPLDQVGSIVTTRPHLQSIFDRSKLPAGLTKELALDLGCDLLERAVRIHGPAATHMPNLPASDDNGIRTMQII